MSELIKACYVTRNIKDDLFVLCSLFYDLCCILWGNSSCSSTIFKIQKTIVRVITNFWSRDSGEDYLRNWIFLHYNHNIYFPFYYLSLTRGIYINPILRDMVLTRDIVLIYILYIKFNDIPKKSSLFWHKDL